MVKQIFISLLIFGTQAQAHFCGAYFMAPKIVLISGTDRPGSNTLKISEQVVAMMKAKGHDVTLIDLATMDKSQLNGEYFTSPAAFKNGFIPKLIEADGVIFVFPEYHGDYPGVLKMFIDYISPASAFGGKPIGMITNSDGILGGQKGAETLSGVMRHRKADVIGESLVLIPNVGKQVQENRVQEPALLHRLEAATDAIVKRASSKYQMQMQINEFLDLAITAKSAINVELSSQVQITGHVTQVQKNDRGFPISLSLKGPIEISSKRTPISYQLFARQSEGLFIPVGLVKSVKGAQALSDVSSVEKLAELGIKMREPVSISYTSGIEVKGLLSNAFFSKAGRLQVLTLNDATVSKDGILLKEYSTDLMELLIGESISSVSQFKNRQ